MLYLPNIGWNINHEKNVIAHCKHLHGNIIFLLI